MWLTGWITLWHAGGTWLCCEKQFLPTGSWLSCMDYMKGSQVLTGWFAKALHWGDNNHSLFCSELVGIYNILYWLVWHLKAPMTALHPTFCLACNGKLVSSCLLNLHQLDQQNLMPIYLGTIGLLQQVGFKVWLIHIKGHWDVTFPMVLKQNATLNMEVD